jgi:hypothetical protein
MTGKIEVEVNRTQMQIGVSGFGPKLSGYISASLNNPFRSLSQRTLKVSDWNKSICHSTRSNQCSCSSTLCETWSFSTRSVTFALWNILSWRPRGQCNLKILTLKFKGDEKDHRRMLRLQQFSLSFAAIRRRRRTQDLRTRYRLPNALPTRRWWSTLIMCKCQCELP